MEAILCWPENITCMTRAGFLELTFNSQTAENLKHPAFHLTFLIDVQPASFRSCMCTGLQASVRLSEQLSFIGTSHQVKCFLPGILRGLESLSVGMGVLKHFAVFQYF